MAVRCRFYPQADDPMVCCCGRAKGVHGCREQGCVRSHEHDGAHDYGPVRVELPPVRVQGFDRMLKTIGAAVKSGT